MRRSSRNAGVAILAVLVAGLLPDARCCRPFTQAPRGIVLIVIDTLRADRLSVYGNARPTSPSLERVAAEGVVFEQAFSHASWTLPAFVGLLTGVYPDRSPLDQHLRRSLVEDLKRRGRTTAAFTEGGYVSSSFGFDLGFDEYASHEAHVRLIPRGGKAAPRSSTGVEQTFDAGLAWLREHAAAPFFLMLHTYEVHMPYLRRDFASELERGAMPEHYTLDVLAEVRSGARPVGETEARYVQALYDGGVRKADEQIGRVLALLDELELAEDTLLIVTSDHGEALGERSLRELGTHGVELYDSLLRVPLLLRYPARVAAGARISTQVRLVDVLPTALDFAGVALPTGLDGKSLVPVLEGDEPGDRLAVAAHYHKNSDIPSRVAIRDGEFKLILNLPPREPGTPDAELYELAADPGERHEIAAREPARKEALQRALREVREGARRVSTVAGSDVPAELRERLHALGYAD